MQRLPFAIAQLLARPAHERKLGAFVLLHQLGQGGFAPVWAAKETYGGTELRDAAVKLFALGRHSSVARDRVIREAQALCRVNHVNIVRFYSLALDEHAGVGGLAMELVAGTSLGRRITSSGPMSVSDVLRVGIAVAQALAEVHRAGLLHRDVKPDNIIETEGTYKLIDFGIAASAENEDEVDNDAEPGQTAKVVRGVPGTPGFVAPEYYQDEPASIVGELYALGATLHSCLVGFPPAATTNQFPWQLDPDVLEGRSPAPLVALRTSASPQALVELIENLVSPNPERRPKSAALVAQRLEAIQQAAEEAKRARPSSPRRRTFAALALAALAIPVIALSVVRNGSSSANMERGLQLQSAEATREVPTSTVATISTGVLAASHSFSQSNEQKRDAPAIPLPTNNPDRSIGKRRANPTTTTTTLPSVVPAKPPAISSAEAPPPSSLTTVVPTSTPPRKSMFEPNRTR